MIVEQSRDTMKRRVRISLILFLLMGITQVFAQDNGYLHAEGDGVIAFNGRGQITIQGEGNLFVVDRTHDAVIVMDSKNRTRPTTHEYRGSLTYSYRDFDGSTTLSGEDIAFILNGTNISLSISGTGTILLEGDGDYTIHNTSTHWASDGSVLTIHPEND